jgi:hypothetical protein
MPQSCRNRLNRRDFEFMASVLNGRSSGNQEAFLSLVNDAETLNSILDHPKLLEAMVSMKLSIAVSSELYFYVLVRHALKESGIDHREVADYVAGTLVEFARGNPFKSVPGDSLQINGLPYYIEFIEAIKSANRYDQFYLHVHCGNQFLVLTGIFPEAIIRREQRRGAPGVPYYESVAQGSFQTAGEHPLAIEFALSEVYEILADQFRITRRALNRLSKEFLCLGS